MYLMRHFFRGETWCFKEHLSYVEYNHCWIITYGRFITIVKNRYYFPQGFTFGDHIVRTMVADGMSTQRTAMALTWITPFHQNKCYQYKQIQGIELMINWYNICHTILLVVVIVNHLMA